MTRRKGTPCACECDPCKGKNSVRTINNISPDTNGDFIVEAGTGIAILQTGDNSFSISFDGTYPDKPMIFKGTLGSGGDTPILPDADPDNIGWTYLAIEDGTVPVTFANGDTLLSNGYTWVVIPSGQDPVDWSQILNKPTTISGYGITDAYTKAEVDAADDTKLDKITAGSGTRAYIHAGSAQRDKEISESAAASTIPVRKADGTLLGANPASGSTDNALATTNWISQTGDAAPNNLVHKSGNETINGIKTLNNGIVGYAQGWYRIPDTINVGEYYVFAKIDGFSVGGHHIYEFMQSSNTTLCYGLLMVKEGANESLWLTRKSGRGSNNPLSATSIFFASDGTDRYLIWKKEVPYGRLVIREVMSQSYGVPRPYNDSKTTFYDAAGQILPNLDSFAWKENPPE